MKELRFNYRFKKKPLHMESNKLKILIADDHTLFREGVGKIVSRFPLVGKVIYAGTGTEALEQIRLESPEVVLLDIQMPDKTGFDVLTQMTDENLSAKVIMLSMHEESHFVQKAHQFGASGYLKKDCEAQELKAAIEAVHGGKNYYAKDLQSDLFEYLLSNKGAQPAQETVISEREGEVLSLLCKQKTTGEISEILSLSEETVKTHRKSLLRKTESKNLAGLVVFGIKNGYFKA